MSYRAEVLENFKKKKKSKQNKKFLDILQIFKTERCPARV